MVEEQHDWKCTQCFGDKGDADDITDGMLFVSSLMSKWTHLGPRGVLVMDPRMGRNCGFLFRSFCSWPHHGCRVRPYRWLFSDGWQGRSCRFIWTQRRRRHQKQFYYCVVNYSKQRITLTCRLETRLRVQIPYRVSVAWSRVWLSEKFGDRREDQQG